MTLGYIYTHTIPFIRANRREGISLSTSQTAYLPCRDVVSFPQDKARLEAELTKLQNVSPCAVWRAFLRLYAHDYHDARPFHIIM
jgi:hypothetical protein